MSTYEKAGVNIELGDSASSLAYQAAKSTFPSRQGMIGAPVEQDGGFTGALDFGDFYLIQNDDGVGTKILISEALNDYETLGYDLLAMVADDATCVGAEVISCSNTIDTNKVNPEAIGQMMAGFAKACIEQKIVIPGGEIAELGGMVTGSTWNATAVGVAEKDKFITGDKVKEGDIVIGLKSNGFRSNGFSLIRYILNNQIGEGWVTQKYNEEQSWGEVTLTPSLIYHSAILKLTGRYKQKRKVNVHGIVHVTGGGIGNNLKRILKNNNLGANLDNLIKPHEAMLKLQEMGSVEDFEAYKTWNMGTGMLVIIDPSELDLAISLLKEENITCQKIGEISSEKDVKIKSRGYFEEGKELKF